MKRIGAFYCFYLSLLSLFAQSGSYMYTVLKINDLTTMVKGHSVYRDQPFNNIAEIQFTNCHNAFIIAFNHKSKTNIYIRGKCVGSKIISESHDLLGGYAFEDRNFVPEERPNDYGYNSRGANLPASYEDKSPYLTGKGSNSDYTVPNQHSADNLYPNAYSYLSRDETIIIVVGAFIEKQNADHTLSRIIAEGYKPYMAQNGTFTRVGIKVNYQSLTELDNMINVIRSRYNPEAYIIKP